MPGPSTMPRLNARPTLSPDRDHAVGRTGTWQGSLTAATKYSVSATCRSLPPAIRFSVSGYEEAMVSSSLYQHRYAKLRLGITRGIPGRCFVPCRIYNDLLVCASLPDRQWPLLPDLAASQNLSCRPGQPATVSWVGLWFAAG